MTNHEKSAAIGHDADLLSKRLQALEQAFDLKGLIPENYFDAFRKRATEEWHPENGARVVARAWTDPGFLARLREDGKAAIEELGFALPEQQRQLIALEDSRTVHNAIVCTLCSCTAFTLLGVAPHWYKDLAYRARIVREARTVLREMGTDLPDEVEIRVWDTTADTRYMVIPARPDGTGDWSLDELTRIVTKESMIGVSRLDGIGRPTNDVASPKAGSLSSSQHA